MKALTIALVAVLALGVGGPAVTPSALEETPQALAAAVPGISPKPPAGVIVHEAPDKNYSGGFDVRCRTGGAHVTIKEGQSSKQKCPGKGKVDQITPKARQIIACRAGHAWFDLFKPGTTYLIAAAQGGYLCRSRRP